jgi:dihydroorotate dehydrogenase (NAD+) catalytic subunit
VTFPGGFLLHSGLPNPGLRAVLKANAERWANAPLPILVHLLGDTPREIGEMVARLEGLDGVIGVEIGLAPGVERETAAEMAFAAVGELAVVVCLPPERLADLGPYLAQAGVETISLSAPRGVLPNGRSRRLVAGRLYGPALLPAAIGAVLDAHRLGFDVIASGGGYTQADVDALLAAGAFAVELDAVLWRP